MIVSILKFFNSFFEEHFSFSNKLLLQCLQTLQPLQFRCSCPQNLPLYVRLNPCISLFFVSLFPDFLFFIFHLRGTCKFVFRSVVGDWFSSTMSVAVPCVQMFCIEIVQLCSNSKNGSSFFIIRLCFLDLVVYEICNSVEKRQAEQILPHQEV